MEMMLTGQMDGFQPYSFSVLDEKKARRPAWGMEGAASAAYSRGLGGRL